MWHFAIGCYRPQRPMNSSLRCSTVDIRHFSHEFQCRSLLFGHLWCICACQALAVFNGDRIEAIDLIHGHDVSDDAIFEDLLCLANSGRIGAALAAPYCSKHSRTTLRSPGPPPTACFLKVGFPIGHVRLIEDIISQPAVEKPWSNVWSGIWLVDSWRVTPIFIHMWQSQAKDGKWYNQRQSVDNVHVPNWPRKQHYRAKGYLFFFVACCGIELS